MSAVSRGAFRSRQTSKPSRRGIITSSTIRSGSSLAGQRQRLLAVRGLARTRYPSAVRLKSRMFRMAASSSQTRILRNSRPPAGGLASR